MFESIITKLENRKLRNAIDKLYWKNDQVLYLHNRYDEKDCRKKGTYFYDAVYVQGKKDGEYYTYHLFDIQTYSNLIGKIQLGSTPYFMVGKFGYLEVTIPKFGQLTDEDIFKAIEYYFDNAEFHFPLLIFNIQYNNKQVWAPHNFRFPLYRSSTENIESDKYYRGLLEKKKKGKKK